MIKIETIVALATPPGRGGVSIVRISGPKASHVIDTLLKKTLLPRYATYIPFFDVDNTQLDQGIALWFPQPYSLTGEDVLELQGHGGPVVAQLLIKAVLTLGVRLAKPGEFLERSFLNGKIDLTQAEATADLIDSVSEVAVKSALKSLQGEFSSQVNKLVEALIQLRTYVEAAIDFPEEDVDFLTGQHVSDQLTSLELTLDGLIQTANQGSLCHSGLTLALAGKPNAGKSSILNALVGDESAIVTDVAGTTRDLIRESLHLDGLKINLIDTAGLRQTQDQVEKVGIEKAMKAISGADCILLVMDARETSEQAVESGNDILPDDVIHSKKIIYVRNKIDLLSKNNSLYEKEGVSIVNVSAKTGQGMDLLKTYIKNLAGFDNQAPNTFSARQRHLDQLKKALNTIQQARIQFDQIVSGELLAEDLREAQNALSEITGAFSADDLLGRIFSEFCMGK